MRSGVPTCHEGVNWPARRGCGLCFQRFQAGEVNLSVHDANPTRAELMSHRRRAAPASMATGLGCFGFWLDQ